MKARVLRTMLLSAFCVTLAVAQGAAVPAIASADRELSTMAAEKADSSQDDDSKKASDADSSEKKKNSSKKETTKKNSSKKETAKKKEKKTDWEKAEEKAKKKLKKKKEPVSVKVGKTTWYFTKDGKLRATQKGKKYYYLDGTVMTKSDEQDFTTLLAAEEVVADITKPSMSKKKKLSVCFSWVMKKYYGTHRRFENKSGWPAVYAMDHFNNKNGDCHSDGAAFAYLAVACGYKNVYACLDSKQSGSNTHGWAEVDKKAYDPLFAQAKSYSRNYAASYKTYGLSAIVKVPIPYASTKSHEESLKRHRFPDQKEESKTSKKNKTSWKVRGWDVKKKHLFYKDGRKVTGTVYYKKKLFVFSEKGNLSKKKTAKIRKAAKRNADASVLLELAGKPTSKFYSDSCFGDGKDGLFEYHTFQITTFRPSDGSTEIVMGVEGR